MVAGVVTAYVDESLRLDGTGLYVLAAVVVPASRADEVRAALRDGLRRGQRRYHFRKQGDESRLAMCQRLAALSLDALVVTTQPVDPARQERARRHCLVRLLWLLDRRDVHDVVLESRQSRDRLDAEIVRHALRAGWVSSSVTFGSPDGEPLLWAADVVAGAVRADRNGDGRWLAALGASITVVPAP